VNVGTPHYMSPEQCRGGKVDARSDLYALGIMFYETVTGRLPFDGPTPVDIWQAHVEKMPLSPREVVPESISPELSDLIMKLLAKNPERRPQSAAEFCDALEALAASNQLEPRPADVEPAAKTRVLNLAQALRSTPVCDDWVSLDAAADLPSVRGARASEASVAPVTVPMASSPHQPYQDVAATFRDLPAISDVDLPVMDRFQEIDDLRASLGLQIEEPASNESQVSALVINLEANKPSPSGNGPTPGPVNARPVLVNRPIEERQYLPQLAAPRRADDSTASRNLPSRHSRLVRGGVMAIVLIAATVVAVWLGR
jgi:serine/threonine protein kinase